MTYSDEPRVTVRIKLSALWVALTLLYVYADVLSLFRPGQLEEMTQGRMGPVGTTQGTLLVAATIVVVPAVMVFLTLTMRPGLSRWTNFVLGIVYTAVNVANLVGETWVYYLLFGALEISVTTLIVWYAWRWHAFRRPPVDEVREDTCAWTWDAGRHGRTTGGRGGVAARLR